MTNQNGSKTAITAKQSQSLETTSKRLSAIENALLTAAQATRKELTPGEIHLWELTLKELKPTTQEIQESFVQYFKTSVFFPMPADILRLVVAGRKSRREQELSQRQQAEREETERRRAKGECFGLADVMTKFKQIVAAKAMPVSPETKANLLRKVADLKRSASSVTK